MFRRIFGSVIVGVTALGITACTNYAKQDGSGELGDVNDYSQVDPGALLYPASKDVAPAPMAPGTKADPLVLPDCRLAVYERQEVPAEQDGVILCIGRELTPEEPDPSPDRLFIIKEIKRTLVEKKAENPKPNGIKKETYGSKDGSQITGETDKPKEVIRRFRLLKEDDYVVAGQMMAILDDRLARDDFDIKDRKVSVAEKDYRAAEKARDEYYERFRTQERLLGTGTTATSMEDYRASKLLWDKSTYEAQSKREAYFQAMLEKNQSATILTMHEIRSKISGVIKTIYRKKGESVKKYEAVFQVLNLQKLRAEGLLDCQFVRRAAVGWQATVEPSEPVPPDKTLGGHFHEITGVATGQLKNQQVIVSCDENTVRVWNRSGTEIRSIDLPRGSGGRSVACSPAKSGKQFCVCGSNDGVTRVWDLDNPQKPLQVLKDQHRGAVTSIGISPDGKTIATGGDDRMICLWNAENGELRYKLEGAHRGTVTSLQFTPKAQLVSAARDNTLKVWTVGEKAARIDHNFGTRVGDVTVIGANPDGSRVLFDEGKKIRVIALPGGQTESELQNEMGAANFSTFALYSPDGNLIVTAGGSEGRLQLWRAPNALDRRGAEVRQLVPSERTVITSAAFSQDGAFLVAAGRDKRLRIWPIPTAKEIDQRITARVTRVEPAMEGGGGQVRVWADFEIPNRDNKWMPGMPVTLAIKPGE